MAVRRRDAARTPRPERGAAAVEFALVMMLLLPMLFGIVDFGLWFNDSLNVRQGVREAARMGVVQTFSCSTGTTDLERLACATRQQVAPVAGTTYAKVLVSERWVKGAPLVVCAMVRFDGGTGVTPLPANRIIRSKTQLSIEVATTVPIGASATGSTSFADTPPANTDWTWCK